MIIDKLKNAGSYYCLGENFEKGLKFLEENYDKFGLMECGNYEIDGTNVYAMVKRYDTRLKEDLLPETHKNYADIQLIFKGKESIGYTHLDDIDEVEVKPLSDKDMYYHEAKCQFVTVNEGYFLIAMPQDVHQPESAVDDMPSAVVKIVVKVKM